MKGLHPMEMEETSAEASVRLRPALEEVFSAYGISEEAARQILEDACGILISKRWDRQNPGRWLLRTVIERCRRRGARDHRRICRNEDLARPADARGNPYSSRRSRRKVSWSAGRSARRRGVVWISTSSTSALRAA